MPFSLSLSSLFLSLLVNAVLVLINEVLQEELFNFDQQNLVIQEGFVLFNSQSCLAVRFLRYEIEKGLRAVYFSRPELSPLGSYTLSPPPLPLCWCTVSRQDFADSLPGASATVLRLQQSGSALGWTLALIR